MSVIDKNTPIVANKLIYAPANVDADDQIVVNGVTYIPAPSEIEVQTVHAVAFRLTPTEMFWVPRHKLVMISFLNGVSVLAYPEVFGGKIVAIKAAPKKAHDDMVVIIKAETSGKTTMAVRLRVDAGSNKSGKAEEIWFPAYLCSQLDEGFWSIKAIIAVEKGIQAHVG
ncbi:hypothetical protein [Roseococcus pinisoli]|uniref:Uncharacterized protein n=1 Tax=Roseococcus pinisoli TaxID=2835040 RepID=A0ABS5QIK4_9PROT|nr:hypothetical protein [Roseococcus pinisoli]MBS7812373.1 hypothetical protein [Roseococcus pinisoli]